MQAVTVYENGWEYLAKSFMIQIKYPLFQWAFVIREQGNQVTFPQGLNAHLHGEASYCHI
jgi:hypothetical protein